MHKFFFYIKTFINLSLEFFCLAFKSVQIYVIAVTVAVFTSYHLFLVICSNFFCLHYSNFWDTIVFNIPTFAYFIEFYVNVNASNIVNNCLLNADLSSQTASQLIPYLQGNLFFVLQMLFLVVISIWARAAGPRARLDQLFTMTWKDMFIKACLFSLFIYILFIFV